MTPNIPEPASNPSHSQPTFATLRDVERLWRRNAIQLLRPFLPAALKQQVRSASQSADRTLDELATIDLEEISDRELQPARIKIGLMLVGFGALTLLLLMIYLDALHPELTPAQRIRFYWHPYIGLVCLGLAGMFMLGREAMRPPEMLDPEVDTDPASTSPTASPTQHRKLHL